VRAQLLAQGASASSETIIESFYRCAILELIQREYHVASGALPACVNSSHLPPRKVCLASGQDTHLRDSPSAWAAGWNAMRQRYAGVDLRVATAAGERSLRRADLYVIAGGEIVSIEFKYVGARGIGNVAQCVRQMAVYLREHAASLFVVYTGADGTRELRNAAKVEAQLPAGVPVFLSGPAVAAALVSGRPRVLI
jgi:hypothetical protein